MAIALSFEAVGVSDVPVNSDVLAFGAADNSKGPFDRQDRFAAATSSREDVSDPLLVSLRKEEKLEIVEAKEEPYIDSSLLIEESAIVSILLLSEGVE